MEKGVCKIKPTEFFDIAALQGFYGLERGGLIGKKDYVRKYWEDITIKLAPAMGCSHGLLCVVEITD